MVKLYIAIPCYGGTMGADFALSLFNNLRSLDMAGIPYLMNVVQRESLIVRARNVMASSFLSTDCSHLLFLDNDLSFPDGSILKLIHSEKDIVCGAYPKKKYNFEEIIKVMTEEKLPLDQAITKTSDYIFNPLDVENVKIENACIEVREAGTGMMLIKRNVIESLIGKEDLGVFEYKPYPSEDAGHKCYTFFDCGLDENKYYLSEDYKFCWRIRKLGYKCYLRVDIPMNHQGIHSFVGNFANKLVFTKPEEKVLPNNIDGETSLDTKKEKTFEVPSKEEKKHS